MLIVAGWGLISSSCDPGTTVTNPTQKIEARYESSGHADAAAEAFIHWDEDDPALVPTSCARCHSSAGFLDFLDNGVVDSPAEPGVITCEVCHSDRDAGIPRDLGSVTFPSGAVIAVPGSEAICMQCHQGRASTTSVDNAIAAAGTAASGIRVTLDDDTINENLSFINIHYYGAAATMYGTLAKGGYQYAGKSYDGKFAHLNGYGACTDCHDPHSLKVKTERCSTCHTNVKGEADLHDIRFYGSLTDYDGDGNIGEGIYYEVQGIAEKLYAAIQKYARGRIGVPIGYDAHTHPYFFIDTDDNGVIDESEATSGNRYRSWTPRLLKAAYNYQVYQKDPGGFAHGGKYLIQLLYDSMSDLNAGLVNPISMAGMQRGDEGHFDGSAEAWRHWDADGEVPASCAKCHSAEGLPYFITNGEDTAQHTANGMLCTTCHTSPPTIRHQDSVTFPSGEAVAMEDTSNICLNCHQGRASRSSVDKAIAAGPGPYGFTNIHYYPAAAVFFGSATHGGYEFPGKTYAGIKTFDNHAGRFDTCVRCHMGTLGESSPIAHNVHKPNPADCVLCHGQDISQPNPGADPTNFEFSGIRPARVPDYDADGNKTESLKDEIQGLEDALYAQLQAHARSIGKPIIYDAHTYPYFFNDTNDNGQVDPGEAIYPNGYQFTAKLLKAAYNFQLSKKEPCGYIHNSPYIAQLLVDSIQALGGSVTSYTWR